MAMLLTRRVLHIAVWLGAVVMAGCGGGGGGGTPALQLPNLTAQPVADTVGGGGTPALQLANLTVQPVADTVVDGGNASFNVVATSSTALSYQWRKNGTPIGGATGATLTLVVSYADNGASFSVVVGNTDGNVTSVAVALTVTPSPPTINTQPLSLAVQSGSAAAFVVIVTGGTAPVTFQWRKNGVDIAGATASVYAVVSASAADNAGAYSVLIVSPSGTLLSAVATLTVSAAPQPPAISLQPQDKTVALGQTATFSVEASSISAITYQWSRNGLAIAGATAATYTTPASVAADEAAQFSVAVLNTTGPTNSLPATLTISNLPSGTVSQVDAGGAVSVALKTDGTVWSWGHSGTLGVSEATSPGVPTRAKNSDGSVFDGVVGVSAGLSHNMAWKADGTAWGWCYICNFWGELGIGNVGQAIHAHPLQVIDAAGAPFTGVSQVSVGGAPYTLAVKTDGTAWAWGRNDRGELGDGSTTERRHPVQVRTATGAPFTGVAKLAAGVYHSLALLTDGTVWAWGSAVYGTLGNGSGIGIFHSTTPVRAGLGATALTNVVAIAAGTFHSVALLADGTAYAWGYNGFGALGDGTRADRQFPTLVKSDAGNPMTDIVAIAAGEGVTVFLKSDGSVWATGYNHFAQLGDNTLEPFRVNPVLVRDATGAGFGGVDKIALTYAHSVVRRADGTVWAWGHNVSRQLGDTTTVDRRSPVRVPVSGP